MNADTKLLPDRLRAMYLGLLNPLVSGLAKLGLHPNAFTTFSFLVGCGGAVLMAAGRVRGASVLLLLSGILDNIDGNLARKTGKVTKFGALFDSTLDRYSETLYFMGIMYFFARSGWPVSAAAAAVALTGSFMVSYIRARAEGLGYCCEIGLIQRPERVVLLGLTGLIHPRVLLIAVWTIAVLSNVTVIQRLVHIWRTDQNSASQAEGKE